jgi:hypothetical protein
MCLDHLHSVVSLQRIAVGTQVWAISFERVLFIVHFFVRLINCLWPIVVKTSERFSRSLVNCSQYELEGLFRTSESLSSGQVPGVTNELLFAFCHFYLGRISITDYKNIPAGCDSFERFTEGIGLPEGIGQPASGPSGLSSHEYQ